jgi:hypothetical protein
MLWFPSEMPLVSFRVPAVLRVLRVSVAKWIDLAVFRHHFESFEDRRGLQAVARIAVRVA